MTGPDVRALRNEQETTFQELCCIFSAYRPATVRSVLLANNYSKAEATNALCELAPDNEDEEGGWREAERAVERAERAGLGKSASEDNSSTTNSEVAQTIINEVYENLLKEEINGREFEELFEEIAEMIKEDQRDRGIGMLEINNFVDECNEVKQTLLVGFREELSSFDDFDFDETYPLYAQTQEFILDTTLKRARQEKKQEEDFPTLGAAGRQQRNIIDRISHEERRRVEEDTPFFAPRRNVPSYARERINEASIFNVDNRLQSERDLMSLHKEFADMPIRDLKFVYMTFVGDYNHSREFLIVRPPARRSTTAAPAAPVPSAPPPRARPPPRWCARTAGCRRSRWTRSWSTSRCGRCAMRSTTSSSCGRPCRSPRPRSSRPRKSSSSTA